MGLRGEAPIYNNNAKQKTSNMLKPKNGVVNPFSDKFWDTWEFYKIYRKETHNFEFKGTISEQMALKKVHEVSGGDDERAIRIVEQTIASGKWSGFYPLKTTTYKENGQSNSKAEQP